MHIFPYTFTNDVFGSPAKPFLYVRAFVSVDSVLVNNDDHIADIGNHFALYCFTFPQGFFRMFALSDVLGSPEHPSRLAVFITNNFPFIVDDTDLTVMPYDSIINIVGNIILEGG